MISGKNGFLSKYIRWEKTKFWTRHEKVQQAEPTEDVSNLDGRLHAVLFNAIKGRFSIELANVYDALIYAGASDSDISILQDDGKPAIIRSSGTQNRFVDGPATLGGLESAVDSIRQRANSNDRLFVYVTNEGNLVNFQSLVKSCNGSISEKQFEQIMQDLPVNFGLFYFTQCFGGGFAERMGYGRNIGMSIASRNETSRASGDSSVGNYFTYRLLDFIAKPGVTIGSAFDSTVNNTYCETCRKIFEIDNGDPFWMLPPMTPLQEVPQLRWQNADPSQLYLGQNAALATSKGKEIIKRAYLTLISR